MSPFQIEPYIPYEFTCEGMLQRVNILIEKQVGWIFIGRDSYILSAVTTATFFVHVPFFPLRTFVPTQQAGPHWARSRSSELTSPLPVKPPARNRDWSVNQHSSLILTVPKALRSKRAPHRNHNLFLYFVRNCLPINFGYYEVIHAQVC